MKQLLLLLVLNSNFIWSQTPFETAQKFFNNSDYTAAKPLFENFLKSNPNHTKTLECLGDIAGNQKNWNKAIEYYQKLKIQFPKNANYQYKFGGALGMKAKNANKFKALSMIDDIENAFLLAAKLEPKHIETRWALVTLYLELPGIIGGSEAKANKYADELAKISPVDGCLSKGFIAEYFKRYKIAEMHFKKAHEIGNSKTTFDKLYKLYLNKLKDHQKASTLKQDFEK